jgi:hypothetical protein
VVRRQSVGALADGVAHKISVPESFRLQQPAFLIEFLHLTLGLGWPHGVADVVPCSDKGKAIPTYR